MRVLNGGGPQEGRPTGSGIDGFPMMHTPLAFCRAWIA